MKTDFRVVIFILVIFIAVVYCCNSTVEGLTVDGCNIQYMRSGTTSPVRNFMGGGCLNDEDEDEESCSNIIGDLLNDIFVAGTKILTPQLDNDDDRERILSSCGARLENGSIVDSPSSPSNAGERPSAGERPANNAPQMMQQLNPSQGDRTFTDVTLDNDSVCNISYIGTGNDNWEARLNSRYSDMWNQREGGTLRFQRLGCQDNMAEEVPEGNSADICYKQSLDIIHNTMVRNDEQAPRLTQDTPESKMNILESCGVSYYTEPSGEITPNL